VEGISGDSAYLHGHEEADNPLKAALPESLGDVREKGFPKRLGRAMKKRKDQIFEAEGGFVKLKEALPDRHRQKLRWKLIHLNAAPFAPFCNGHTQGEERIPETSQGAGNGSAIISFPRSGALEKGAKGANDAKEEPFTFKDDPEERAAIQGEER
jgi:hypothetical protein